MHLERYEIGAIIVEGERTTVRRARRTQDGTPVIIKTPSPAYPSVRELRRLEFEYEILDRLKAPGVIRALGLEQEGGRLALILEDFGGERLPSEAGGLGLELFFSIASGVTQALGQVHAQNVIHKDIKPHNILMNPNTREVKLIDFGFASELSREHLELRPTTQLQGTVLYMSPEQTGRMNRDLDYRTDYYALGVTFFELLTGSLPFLAPDVLGMIHCHISKPVPDPRELRPNLPEGLCRLVCKLLAKNPDERYQSARGLLEDLGECQRSWEKTGSVPSFALGTHDVSERFQVSQQLVGREVEAAKLLSIFDVASRGPAQLLFVAGYSGVGKSSLIREIYKSTADRRATFIAGKFDQLERNLPYGAITQALKELVKEFLAEPEEIFAARKRRLLEALGANGNVLIGLVPELEQVIGPQPAVPDLPAREAQGRIQRVLRDFIKAVASAAHPLVIFLDDLQWTDGSTPQLLVDLLGDEELRHLLLIGAYRDNEVSEGHLLRVARAELEDKRPGAVHEIKLEPLSEASLNRLVASTLHCEPQVSQGLSKLLFQRTAGNPFFLNELLGQLHHEGALRFATEQGRWTWQDEQVARAAVTENVADLMVQRLNRLPLETLECLRLAACLGNDFDLTMLAQLAHKPAQSVGAALRIAVQERLLFPRGDDYRLLRDDEALMAQNALELSVRYQFPHDRVLQAVYSLLGEDERAAVHLRIGRMLLSAAGEAREQKVFDFVDHLNLGRKLLTEFQDRDELSRFNYAAGERARGSAAYGAAALYLETSLNLLSEAEWTQSRERHFECLRMHAECIFLSGNVELATRLCEELFAHAPDKVLGASAYCLKATILELQSRLAEAVDTIRQGLKTLDVELPEDFALIDQQIGVGIGKMQAHLARTRIEDLAELPETTDRLRIATMDLLFQLIPSASQMHPPLFILAELILFDFALTYGTTAASAKNFVDCGIVLGAILNDFERAYRMGKVAFVLLDRHAPTPLESSVNFVFGCFISHWGAHFSEGLDALARSHKRGIELGDVQHAAYAIVHRAIRLLFAGRDLAECRTQTERALAYTAEAKAVGQATAARIVERALLPLSGSDLELTRAAAVDDAFIEEVTKTGNAHWLLVLGMTQTLVSMVLGDAAGARKWDAFTALHIGVGHGTFPVPDHYLFQSLILTKNFHTKAEDERVKMRVTLSENQAKLAGFAQVSPTNFSHKYLLCSAEIARVQGEPIDAVLRLYNQALRAMGEDFLHQRALTNELLANFWRERGHAQLARDCVFEAYYLYRRWGADAKLRLMEQEHSQWFGRTALSEPPEVRAARRSNALSRDTVELNSLDLASVVKATQAISGEVQPARLFSVLMQTIIENAGAQHGYLIARADEHEELAIQARASIADSEPHGMRSMPLAECDGVAQDVIRYVVRTHETVVLDDARVDSSYRDDAHIKRDAVKSLLCMPILNQAKIVAILYAENNAATHAFTPERLSLLRVIAGQAAISIANAQLYENLERKVSERTRELSERNREVAAMLHSLQQGIFTIDQSLSIQTSYSAHLEELLGTRQIAGLDCLELLFRDANLAPDTIKTMRTALAFSFGVTAPLAEANTCHLVREFHKQDGLARRSFEVDWTLIVDHDELVRKILVTLREVTVLQQLSALAAQHARELDIVGQILDAGLEHFRRFHASAKTFMLESKELLAPVGSLSKASVEQLFRNMHTVKGNARMLGLSHLANAVHAAEECFGPQGQSQAAIPERAALFAGVKAVLDSIEEYARVCERKLGDMMHGQEARTDVAWGVIAAQVAAAKAGSQSSSAALADIERALRRAKAVSLREVAQHSARILPGLAQELGKLAPRFEVEDDGILLGLPWPDVIGDALVHAFQNAVDHGLETAEARQQQGKPAQGTIRLRAERTADGATLRLGDDGRGLRVEVLREQQGTVAGSDEQVAAWAFVAGVSTATHVTRVSGRGVGLDAVRSFVRQHGGDVSIAFTGEARDGFRPFELVFQLPAAAVLSDLPELLAPADDPSGVIQYAGTSLKTG